MNEIVLEENYDNYYKLAQNMLSEGLHHHLIQIQAF